jgi:hypothetical protein
MWPPSSFQSRSGASGLIRKAELRALNWHSQRRLESHPPASRHPGQIGVAAGYERVARVLALADRGQRKLPRQGHWQVLHRVHGDIGALARQRFLELLDEQALAADLGERNVEPAVALRGETENADLHARV